MWNRSCRLLFFSGLIRSRTVLLFGPLLTGLSGLNHIYYYNTAIYIMYTAVAMMLCLLFYPARKTRTGFSIMFFLFLILPWAGPYSVVVIPAALLHLFFSWQSRSKRFLLLTAIFSTIFYFLTVSGNTAQFANITKLGVITLYFQKLLEKVVLFSLFGSPPLWLWFPVTGSSLCLWWFFRRDIDFLKNSLIMLVIITGSLALFFLSIKFPLYLFPSSCHRFLSEFFWCIYLLFVVDRVLQKFHGSGVGRLFFVFIVIGFVVVDNIKDPRKREVKTLEDTGRFVRSINSFEQMHLEKNRQFVELGYENYQAPAFMPIVKVGSREENAVQLEAHNFSETVDTRFILDLAFKK